MAQLVEALCYKAKGRALDSLQFIIDLILPAAPRPWDQLTLKHKYVPGIFPGSKGGWCVQLTTLSPSRADCLENEEPQPPGILKACPDLQRDSVTLLLFSLQRYNTFTATQSVNVML